MAASVQELNGAAAQKLLKTLGGSRSLGQSTQTAPNCALSQTDSLGQDNCLQQLIPFSSNNDTGEISEGHNKSSHCAHAVAVGMISSSQVGLNTHLAQQHCIISKTGNSPQCSLHTYRLAYWLMGCREIEQKEKKSTCRRRST